MDLLIHLRKITNRFPRLRLVVLLATDIVLIAFSIWFSFFLRFEGNIPGQYFLMIKEVIILSLFFCLPIFYFVGLYSFSWSYIGINELISLVKAVAIAFLFLAMTLYLSKEFPFLSGYPRLTLVTSFCLVIILCGALRFAKRIYKAVFKNSIGKKRTLIVGAGDAGEQILRSMLNSRAGDYSPIGFVDDNPAKRGIIIHGLKVLGKISDLPEVIEKNQVAQLVVALPSAGNEVIRKAVELARSAGLRKIKITPPLSEIIKGQVSFKNLKDVEAEDLLGREQIQIDTKEIERLIKDNAVLISGAAGSIGSELSRQTAEFKPLLLVLLDQDETGIFNISEEIKNKYPDLKIQSVVADIRDKEKMEEIMRKFSPKIVFHAAAYKHVPLMEEQPDEAIKNNILGTKSLAEACLESSVEKFVQISTDKAVNPTSVMGATKRVCEMVCQALNRENKTEFISVRFGNVLDSRGSVIPTFREQIKRGGPVEVTHPEMKRYFMLISEACLLVMQSAAMGRGGEVFVLDMGKPVKILDLAREMIRLSGLRLDKDIAIVFTGIRPGEKLFEEMLTAEEGTVATRNKKIFIAKLSPVDAGYLSGKIGELERALSQANAQRLVEMLKEITPFYK